MKFWIKVKKRLVSKSRFLCGCLVSIFRKLHPQLPDQKKSVAGFSSPRLRERDFVRQGGQTIPTSSNIIHLFLSKSNFVQHHPTSSNIAQHGWPNRPNIVNPTLLDEILRWFGRGFTYKKMSVLLRMNIEVNLA